MPNIMASAGKGGNGVSIRTLQQNVSVISPTDNKNKPTNKQQQQNIWPTVCVFLSFRIENESHNMKNPICQDEQLKQLQVWFMS